MPTGEEVFAGTSLASSSIRKQMRQPSGSLGQPPAGDPARTLARDARQRPGPAEPDPSGQRDHYLTPSATQAGDTELRGLWHVHRKATVVLLRLRRIRSTLVEPIPGTKVLPENLLCGLGGQLSYPFPTGERIGAGGAKLAIDLRDRRSPSDATVAAGVPLVQQIPQRPRGVPLSVKHHPLRRRGVDPSNVGAMSRHNCRR